MMLMIIDSVYHRSVCYSWKRYDHYEYIV